MKSNLYTRTGDDGTTSLVDGSRIQKDSLRLEAYGTLDEFSSFLGVVLSHKGCPEEIKGQMIKIQSLLFDFGAYLASPPSSEYARLEGVETELSELEGWIDALDEQTPKIRKFILPGGAEISAHCHVARAVCRRAERRILSLAAQEKVELTLMRYMNRLSDYLFIAARYLNFITGIEEITWESRNKK